MLKRGRNGPRFRRALRSSNSGPAPARVSWRIVRRATNLPAEASSNLGPVQGGVRFQAGPRPSRGPVRGWRPRLQGGCVLTGGRTFPSEKPVSIPSSSGEQVTGPGAQLRRNSYLGSARTSRTATVSVFGGQHGVFRRKTDSARRGTCQRVAPPGRGAVSFGINPANLNPVTFAIGLSVADPVSPARGMAARPPFFVPSRTEGPPESDGPRVLRANPPPAPVGRGVSNPGGERVRRRQTSPSTRTCCWNRRSGNGVLLTSILGRRRPLGPTGQSAPSSSRTESSPARTGNEPRKTTADAWFVGYTPQLRDPAVLWVGPIPID